MKKTILTVIAFIVFLFIAVWLFHLVTNINSNDIESTPVTEEVTAYEEIQTLRNQTPEEPVEYNNYVYLGGPWGLVIGNKKEKNFQTYVTENKVENVERNGDILQYKELNPDTNGWEVKTINLKAFSSFLEKQ